MKRFTLTAGLVLAVAFPGSASALSHREAVSYGRAYVHVEKVFGVKIAGCKLIGRHASCHGRMTDDRIRRSTDVLHRMFYTPPVRRVVYRTTVAHSSSASSYSGGGYTIPSSIVMCESGGNYRAVNSSSGAGGAYQIMPSTWNGYGGYANAESAPPAVQDQKAAQIWDGGRGRGQWSC